MRSLQPLPDQNPSSAIAALRRGTIPCSGRRPGWYCFLFYGVARDLSPVSLRTAPTSLPAGKLGPLSISP